ncbi:G-type lectin S-receptor-like serine/threonine-protein kinase RKS1 [Medicago truncatula]|uniref:G-type lectin S-receptor-like serine/threonine-protein kinase RKS1 n=1 Tax=Medicago truncatula TaxID=3880 RepID=UPI000D2F3C52|nr:G-type lectin S-receptor-like serine/threonine-protein kinase RKS1 [Medicago truncatula]
MDSAKAHLYLVTTQNHKHKLLLLHNTNNWLLNYLILLLLAFSFCSCSSDIISSDTRIRDGEILISKSKTFALGFFTPGKSTSRYVGIWYNNLPIQTVVWVANRDTPINDTSGILSIDRNGNLVLNHNLSNIPIWSTAVSLLQSQINSTNVIAQLSDIGNLVLMLKSSKTVIWESFDHPTDTLLPYLKVGFDRKTNQSWFLQSWKTDDDPGKGAFTLKFSSIGKPQLFMYNHDLPWWRGGHWNGELFVGIPNMKRDMTTFNVSLVEDDNYVALTYNMFDKSVITRIAVQQSGFFQTFMWDSQKSQWNRYWSEPTDQCDNYGTCGSNNRDGSGGCVRKKGVSVCGNGEGFVKVVSLKVPDTSVAVAKGGLSLEECEKECLRNCSCTAYAVADVRNGGSGCLAWHGDLMDVQKLSDQGQDLFLRVNAIELGSFYSSIVLLLSFCYAKCVLLVSKFIIEDFLRAKWKFNLQNV